MGSSACFFRAPPAAFWHEETEGRDSRENGFILFGEAKKSSLRSAVAANGVIAVVGEGFTGQEPGEFSNDPVAFNNNAVSRGVCDDPLAAFDGDRNSGVVVNRDEIDEGVGAFRRRIQMRHMDNPVYSYPQSIQFRNHRPRLPQLRGLVHSKSPSRAPFPKTLSLSIEPRGPMFQT